MLHAAFLESPVAINHTFNFLQCLQRQGDCSNPEFGLLRRLKVKSLRSIYIESPVISREYNREIVITVILKMSYIEKLKSSLRHHFSTLCSHVKEQYKAVPRREQRWCSQSRTGSSSVP